jgi:hypothetical protein
MAKKETAAKAAPKWEIKDRLYELKGKNTPIVTILKNRTMWFDEEKGYEREVKYTTNQKTVFVDEMKGPERLGHIIFRDGKLFVPKEKTVLQKFLSLYHPQKGSYYEEHDPVAIAEDDIDYLELEIEALNQASQMEVDRSEAILRTELGNSVSKMTSKELKRDLILFARNNPELFLELANDENINIRNMGIKATEQGLIKLSNDQRTFTWASNDKKLITVPFDENPYSALASYFKTDEGIEVYQTIEKRLK